MSDSEIVSNIDELQSLSTDVHWFCPRQSPDEEHDVFFDEDLDDDHEEEVEEKETRRKRVEETSDRARKFFQAVRIMAYEGDAAAPYQNTLKSCLETQLSRCNICVRQYHRCRKQLQEELEAEFDRDTTTQFMERFDQMNTERITKGLTTAKNDFLKMPPERRRIGNLQGAALYSLFETMHCIPFLKNDQLLADYFEEPFHLAQTKQKIFLPTYTPAHTAFLFGSNQERLAWAMRSWSKMKRNVKGAEFDWAVKDHLQEAMGRVQITALEKDFMPQFWKGIVTLMSKLDQNVIAHHLRAMDVDLCKLSLDHLQVDSPCFHDLLASIQMYLEKAPRDFWNALGSISAQTVLEQVFNSPNLDSIIQETGAGSTEELDESLAWVTPFMRSVQPGNLPPTCRTMLHQLWTRLQKQSYPGLARRILRVTGLNVLSQSFSICQRIGTSCTTAISDLLALLKSHLFQIMEDIEKLKATDADVWTASLKVLQEAFAADVVLLAGDRSAVSNKRAPVPDTKGPSQSLWQAAVRGIGPEDVHLAMAIMEGSFKMLAIDQLSEKDRKQSPKEAAAWTERFEQKHSFLRELLERIQDFEEDSLGPIMGSAGTARGFLAFLFAGEPETQQAAATTLRSLTGDFSRREAIGSMLRKHYTPSLRALSDVFRTIIQATVFRPAIMVIKAGTDFIQALCDSQDGVLRSKSLIAEEVEMTESIWKIFWSATCMIFNTTENWSLMGHDKDMMKEFCRDAMDFASQIFDVYSVVSGALHNSSGSDDTRIETDRRLLATSADAASSVVKWLRLRDEYLLVKAVDLICKLMERLQDVDLEMPADALGFVNEIVINSGVVRNKVPDNLKARLRQSLDLHVEKVMEAKPAVDLKKNKKQGSLASWMSSGASAPPGALPDRKKAGGIDLDKWKAAAAQRKDFQAEDDDELKRSLSSAASATNRLKASGMPGRFPGTQPIRPTVNNEAARNDFLRKRKEAEEARKKRDAAIIAEANKSRAGIANAGSGLNGIGIEGKDHSVKGQGVMVSSDESSDDDDGGLDADLFGPSAKPSKRKDTVKQDAAGAIGLKREMKPVRVQRQVRSKKDMRARLQPDLGGLHRTILDWDFFHKGDYPPKSESWQYSKVSNSFRHVDEYKQTFQPLLQLEAWQGLVKAREEDTFKPYELKVGSRMSVDAFVEISTSVTQADLRELQLSEGDVILFSKSSKPTSDETAPHCLARVYGIKRKGKQAEVIYRVTPSTPLNSTLTPGSVIHGTKVQSIIPLEREYGAIAGLMYYDLCDEIIKARPSPLLKYTDKQLDPLISNYNVNKAQAKAIKSAMDNDAFTLIQGPPGSGKTKTIVAIVGALLTDSLGGNSSAVRINRPGAQNTDNAPKKLLICAPSNAAVDELVMRFKEGIKTTRGAEKKINVLRIGRSEAVNSAVQDVTLEEQVSKRLGNANGDSNAKERTHALMQEHKKVSEALREVREKLDSPETKAEERPKLQDELNQVKRRKNELGTRIDNAKDAENAAGRTAELERKRVQQAVIDESHIICSTLSGAGHDLFQSLNVEFETVVVDEAAQCVEMSALIPLKYGCAKCILVGDPKQLPPTVFSKEAARFQYEQSLFVRMQGNHPDSVHLLDTQYRMHPDISAFPSATFYDGRLLDGDDMAGLRRRAWHKSSLLAPYNFFDVQGQHQSAPKGHSLINLAEIEIAQMLYDRLTKDFRDYDFKNKIGIITPYKSQLRQLKETFSHRYGEGILDSVEFNTTDAFQGRESEIIIFSCVRASPAGNIGFLQDIRRMNVGLTRAKCSLWVLGNSDSLMRGEYWKKLVQDAKSRGAYTTGDLKGMLRQSSSNFPAKVNSSKPKPKSSSSPMIKADTDTKPAKPPSEMNGTTKQNGNAAPKVIHSKGSDLALFKANNAPPRRQSSDRMEGVKVKAEDKMAGIKRERESSVSSADKMDIDSPAEKEVKLSSSRNGTPGAGGSSRGGTPGTVSGAESTKVAPPTVAGGAKQHPPAQPPKRKPAGGIFMPKKKQK